MVGNNLNGLLNGKSVEKKNLNSGLIQTGRDINVIAKQSEGNKPYQCKGTKDYMTHTDDSYR